MRTMLERISPVLLASVMVGGFVVTSTLPATAEQRSDRLDHLHAERRNAAPTVVPAAASSVGLVDETSEISEPPADTADPASVATPPPAGSEALTSTPRGGCAGDVSCFLECTRAHESDTSGGYGAVSGSGTYRGAYQFNQNTWAAAVAGAGYAEYSDVPADQVPAEVQDAAAAHLYEVSGNAPWGGLC